MHLGNYTHLMKLGTVTLNNLKVIDQLLERNDDKNKILEVRKLLINLLTDLSNREELSEVKKSIDDIN